MTDIPLSAALLVAVLLTAQTVSAGPILTEIHYNGVASGTDPDEFIELTNAGEQDLDLEGWRFTQGIDYVFGLGATLTAGSSFVLARDMSDFLSVFPGYDGGLLDFTGALSNSGETIALADVTGNEVWSVSYDDRDPWPRAADGLGSSLQLSGDASNISLPENWVAKPPSPGIWDGSLEPVQAVPAPATVFLLITGGFLIPLLGIRNGTSGKAHQEYRRNASGMRQEYS